MRYTDFKSIIKETLLQHPEGLSWKELKTLSNLPYKRACPTWIARLETEIGLVRDRKKGNALIWELNKD